MPQTQWEARQLVEALRVGIAPAQHIHALTVGLEAEREVRRAAAELLAQGMRNDRLSIRGLVRLAVELYDLLYLYPDYETVTLLDELRQQVQ